MKRIDFETALLAKKFGFNYPSPFAYKNDGTKICFHHVESGSNMIDFIEGDYKLHFDDVFETNGAICFGDENCDYHVCTCPTQEELKHWFRVHQNLLIDIYPLDNGSHWEFSITTVVKKESDSIYYGSSYERYDSYEEALENALVKCFEFCQPIPYPEIQY